MSNNITKKQREQVIKDKIFNLSLMKATIWGVGGAAVAGGLTALACFKSKSFNKATSPSARTALIIMPSLFLFGLNFELTTLYASRNPEKFGINDDLIIGTIAEIAEIEKRKPVYTTMPIHHKVLNAVYDKPFYLVAGLGIPFVGYVLKENMKLKHLSFSQKIMHSRVIGQMGVISILLTTMAFKEYMDKHGRFPEKYDNVSVSQ